MHQQGRTSYLAGPRLHTFYWPLSAYSLPSSLAPYVLFLPSPFISLHLPARGVARNLFRRGTKPGDWGQKSPSGSRGRALVGVSEDIYANNHRNNVLPVTKKTLTKFSVWEFPGGHVPLVPLPYAPVLCSFIALPSFPLIKLFKYSR